MYEKIKKDKSGTSSGSYKFFLENYDEFKPLKKLVVFFDSANFLLTPYRVDGRHVHMVLENWNDQQLHINNMNCGYGGEGPSTTAEALQHIGISEKSSENLKLYDGIQIDFDEDGNFISPSIVTDVFFGGEQRGTYEFYLDDCTYMDLSRKKIYMINPQLSNFTGLLNLTRKMKPKEMEYYIGKDSPLENGFRFKEDFIAFRGKTSRYDVRITKGANEVNLIIRGELFDIICLVEKSELMTLINSLYMYIFKKSLFKNKLLGNYITTTGIKEVSFSSILSYYIPKIFSKKETSIHEVIRFEKVGEGMKKWKYRF